MCPSADVCPSAERGPTGDGDGALCLGPRCLVRALWDTLCPGPPRPRHGVRAHGRIFSGKCGKHKYVINK